MTNLSGFGSRWEVVTELLKAGADPYITTNDGDSSFDILERRADLFHWNVSGDWRKKFKQMVQDFNPKAAFHTKTPEQIQAAIVQTASKIDRLLESIHFLTPLCLPSLGLAQSKDEFYEMHDRGVEIVRKNHASINDLTRLYDRMFELWKGSEVIEFSTCFNKEAIPLLQKRLKNDPQRLVRLQFRKIDDLVIDVD